MSKNVSLCRSTTKRDVLILWSNSSKNLVRIYKEFHFNLIKKNFFSHLANISEFAPRKQSRFPTYKCRQTVLPVVSFHSNRCWVLFSEMLEAAAHGAAALEPTSSPPGNSWGHANSSRAEFCFFFFLLNRIAKKRQTT